MLNDSIRYMNAVLSVDQITIPEIVAHTNTPAYIYSLKRILANYDRLTAAFNAHIHYSVKANNNLTILRTLIEAGAGIDAVSAGEIYKALKAGAAADSIVFAGVGKTPDEIHYAVEQGIGWFNVENIAELDYINQAVAQQRKPAARIALRLNPEVTASTHPYIATGHGGAKFGLTAEAIDDILQRQNTYPHLRFEGIHVHIGSQLHDTDATKAAITHAVDLTQPYPDMRTINIGGGLPVAYSADEDLPSFDDFATALKPLLDGYDVLLEPGRSIVADAGVLVAAVLYVKKQAGQTFYIIDGSMAELIRPALYQAHHEIVPVEQSTDALHLPVNVVGPVCETADVLGREMMLPDMQPGDLLALLTTGAYGMVMASNYNARLRPPEIVVTSDGTDWQIARRRETWADLLHLYN